MLRTRFATGLKGMVFLLIFSGFALGQEQTAELTGRITDASGGVIPGAKVTVANATIGIERIVTSNETGDYVVPLLPPGADYQITVSKAGLKQVVRQGIVLSVAQVARVNFTLEVGAITQSVTVVGAAPLLESQTSTLGDMIGTQSIESLPLNGRSPFRLVLLTPGVVFGTLAYGQTGDVAVNTQFDAQFSINGGRLASNEFLIDGVPTAAGYWNQPTTIPDVDATQEFTVQSNNLSAYYGRFAGGVVNVTTKSGTNAFHGSVFEFLRNTVLNAGEFFANKAGSPKPPFQMNQFGAAVGGPLVIPKIFNGKGNTFFFADYQGTQRETRVTALLTVPTALQRTGNFSQTYNSAGVLKTIYNPFSTAPDPANPGQYIRQAFTNNIIPPAMINPVATNLMTWYPTPNIQGQANTNALNFLADAADPTVANIGAIRIDHNVSEHYRLFGRYAMNNTALTQPNYWGNVATGNPGSIGTLSIDNKSFAFNNIYTISPTLLLSVNYGFARYFWARPPLSAGFNVANLGFPASFAAQMAYPMFPGFEVANYAEAGAGSQGYLLSASDSHALLGSLTKISGRHTLTMGADIRMHRLNSFPLTPGGGDFSFTIASTQGPNPNVASATAGDAMASLMLGVGGAGGIPNAQLGGGSSAGGFPINAGNELQDWYYALYLQDDIRVTEKLKVNLGLRWDAESPVTDRLNELAYFDSALASPAANSQFPNLPGGLAFAGVKGQSRTVYGWHKNNFGPRVGFAYLLTPNTDIRTGFGIVYAPLELTNQAVSFAPEPGFSQVTSWVNSLNGLTPYNLINNPFPSGLLEPTGNTLGASTDLGQALSVWDPHPKSPYSMQWNLDVQRQLPADTLLDISYVGSSGVHLTAVTDLDALNPSYLSMGTGLQALVTNPFQPYVSSGTLAQPTVAQSQLLLPYPQFTAVNEVNAARANSIYHAMELKVNKRTKHGVTLLAAYTVSKLISDTTPGLAVLGGDDGGTTQNWYDLRTDRSVSEMDESQILMISGVAELPFGPGNRFLGSTRGAVAKLVGGWRVTGFLSEESGWPLILSDPTAGGGTRPNTTGVRATLSGSRPLSQKVQEWFFKTQFTQPTAFTFGNVGRTLSNVRGPGMHNLDASLIKDTRITERVGLEFHAEAFDLTNTPKFSNPDGGFTSPTFGQLLSTARPPRQLQFALKLIF